MARGSATLKMNRFESCLIALSLLAAPAAIAGDWVSWRGPEQNGVSRETGLPEKWSPDGESFVWCNKDIAGRATPIIMNGRLYLCTNSGEGIREQERIVSLDADTGKLVWEYKLPVFHTTIPNTRVGWTSCVGDPDTGYIYAHATGGLFVCLDRDGKRIWEHSLTEEYGRISGYGGRLTTPVIYENLAIVSFLNASWGEHARGSHRFLACDKRTGDVVWWSQPGGAPNDTNYSVPVVADINGHKLLISGCADGTLAAIRVRTGEPVWTFKVTKTAVNTSPVIEGNLVYVTHSEENIDAPVMGSVICIDAAKALEEAEKMRAAQRTDAAAGAPGGGAPAGAARPADSKSPADTKSPVDSKSPSDNAQSRDRQGAGSSKDGAAKPGDAPSQPSATKPPSVPPPAVPDVTKLAQVWRRDGIEGGYASPALLDGRLYVITNSALLICLDGKTGETRWEKKTGRVGKGSPVIADGKIYTTEVNGRILILKPGDTGCDILDEDVFEDPAGRIVIDVYGGPAVANGRVYFATQGAGVFCFGSKQAVKAPALLPPSASTRLLTYGPPEKAPPDAKPAHILAFPADVSLKTGQTQRFVARAFDDRRRMIGDLDPTWVGPGIPGVRGPLEMTIRPNTPASAGTLAAEYGGLKATSRVRTTPDLPFAEDFEKVEIGKAPSWWVGAMPKFTVEEWRPDAQIGSAATPERESQSSGGATKGPHDDLALDPQVTQTRPPDPGQQPVTRSEAAGSPQAAPPGQTAPSPGGKVLKKKADDPRFARGDVFIGPPDMTGYTIQADVCGSIKRRALPDVGLNNSRYRMELLGTRQKLRIVGWVPMPRIAKEMDFTWKEGEWYTMKMRVDVEGTGNREQGTGADLRPDRKVIVRGKLWPRGEPEPSAWTLELEDPIGQTEGSPGLYAYSPAEMYYDNVRVFKNE